MMEIRDLTVFFTAGEPVVEHLELSVPAGKRTMVIGESGSGKSIMISAIARILPVQASVSGSIRLEGREVLSMTEKELQRIRGTGMAYIPQSGGNSMNPLLTVGFQIAEPMLKTGRHTRKDARSRAVAWMKRLQLGEEERLADAYPHTLSGGMRQRVLIAMGASAGAQLLLADEPTKGLDEERIGLVADLFRKLEEKTLLCVTHDLRFAREMGDYISVMYAAQQVEYGAKDDFFAEPLHPYAQMLLASLPENGLQVTGGFAPPHGDGMTGGCRFAPRCPYVTEQCKTPPPLYDVGERKVRCHRYAGGHWSGKQPDGNGRGSRTEYGAGADRTAPAASRPAVPVLVRAEQISHTYAGRGSGRNRRGARGNTVLRDGCLEIGRGEIVGLVGSSGSGKTTFGRILAGLQKPSAGQLYYRERPVSFPYRKETRRRIQILFQHPEAAFNPRMTLEDSLREVYALYHISYSRSGMLSMLEQFGIYEEHIKRFPAQLSGGELQRLALARVLLPEPELIVLDEPASMLDGISQAQIMRMLMKIRAEKDIAYLLIAHDLRLCTFVSDRVYQIQNGTILPFTGEGGVT